MMVDNLVQSVLEVEQASTLQAKNNRCFFCQGAADGTGLGVKLYDPKTVRQGIGLKQWKTTTISVPRCKRCANVDETLKRYQTTYLITAFLLMAAGTIIGIVTYDIHQIDMLPVILGVFGFLIALAILMVRARKLIRIKGSSGSARMPHLDYAPIKYLREMGWKLGTGPA